MRKSMHTDADDIRMGPLALFTLMIVIALTMLAVMSVSTANTTLTLAERRAQATDDAYADEVAAQTFLAELDGSLGSGVAPDMAVEQARLAAIGSDAGGMSVEASRKGSRYEASFDRGNGRQLVVKLSYDGNGDYHIEEWRMTTVTNDEPGMGTLWGM